MTSIISTPRQPAVEPVIIIGMHRSGTSILTDILRDGGLFMGADLDPHSESFFMQQQNVDMLHACGGNWEHPEVIAHLLEDNDLCQVLADCTKLHLSCPKSIRYLGLRKYLRYHSLYNIDHPWGWKDPRNTFTLPVWLQVFPNAKVVHIYRNGVDVAHSVHKRFLDDRDYMVRKHESRMHRLKYRLNPVLFPVKIGTMRSNTLEHAFDLWHEHMLRAREHIMALPAHRALEIRYEDFLQDPATILPSIISFCGLAMSEQHLQEVSRQINPDRAFAYRKDPGLTRFAHEHSSQLAAFGYAEPA